MRRLMLLGWLGFVGGCHDPSVSVQHTSVQLAVRNPAEADALWETTLEVLRRHQFRIDRRDRAAGVITTFPELSRHWFEFWRRDTVTPYDALESNLQTIRREITVNITPGDDSESRTLSVKVAKQRLSAVEHQVSDPISVRHLYSTNVPTTSGEMRSREASVTWIDLGRDPNLERAIMDRLIAMYGPDHYDFVPEAAEPSLNPQAAASAAR